jgi:hypothetical protein
VGTLATLKVGPTFGQSQSARTVLSVAAIANLQANRPPFKTVRLRLAGNWEHAQLLSNMAIGNGNNGTDRWGGFPMLLATHSNLLYDELWYGYYFTYDLTIANSRSSQIAAVFTYTKHNDIGVFAAAFRWPD